MTLAGWPGRAIIAVAAGLLLVMYARALAGPPVDFGAYYRAAVALREGRSPFEDALIWKAAGYATGSPQPQPTAETAYVYPPALALALLPLTLLTLPAAGAVWLAVLFGCVVGTACCLASLVTARGAPGVWVLAALLAVGIAAFKPVRGALSFSKQVDPLLLLLLAGTITAFVRRRDWTAGILLGLAVAIKPFLAVLALGLLWKGAYRAGLGAGLVAAAVGLGPLLALGLTAEFLAAAAHWAGPAMLASPVSQSAGSLLLRTLTTQPYTVPIVEADWLVAPLQLAIGLGLAGTLAAGVSRSRDEPPLKLLLEWGLGITAVLIFGPLTEEHHLAYLTLGLTGALGVAVNGWQSSVGARRLGLAASALVLFFLLPGTQVVAWGWYAYLDSPIRPPASFATFLFLYATLAAGALNLLALRLLRAQPP